MKTYFLLLAVLFSTQSFAAKCLVTGHIQKGSSCEKISTRLDVSDKEACEAFTKTTRSNKFFGLLDDGDELTGVDYSFKDRSSGDKDKQSFAFADSNCG